MLRLFIAIELPAETKRAIAALQAELRPKLSGVRWVQSDSIHLTLKFLGSVPAERVEEIAAALRPRLQSQAPLQLQASTLGVFPGLQRPRVIWVGVAGEVDRLARLQAEVEAAMATLGFPPEKRRFQPHLTIGRIKDGRRRPELAALMTAPPRVLAGPFDAREVIVYKSDLRPTGAIYTKLQCLPLPAPPSN